MNDLDRIILNQANMMRALTMILGVIALAAGKYDTKAHQDVHNKLMNAAQEAEDYALRNQHMQ